MTYRSRPFVALAAERSPLCVGIDPSRESLAELGHRRRRSRSPPVLRAPRRRGGAAGRDGEAAGRFFRAARPGGDGGAARHRRPAHAHGALVILDAKRGDIASTATAYGEAFLGPDSAFGGDAITVSAYLGYGSLAPILDIARGAGAGTFIVVRSSNPEGSDVQRARLPDGRTVAEHLAERITADNTALAEDGLGPIGAVVGATLGDETMGLVGLLPNALMLVPGIGAQGATVADVRVNFGRHARRVIPTISRGISRAGPDPDALRRRVEQYAEESRGLSG